MHTVPLRATAAFPYAGRALSAGDTFHASERDAHILELTSRAERVPVDLVEPPMVQMVALRDFERVSAGERLAAGEVFEAHDVEAIGLERYGKAKPVADVEPKPKRRYRRRDLRAEP